MLLVFICFNCSFFYIYRLTGDEAGTPYDKESMAIIHLNNTTVMYLKEVTKFLALVCFLREESFERKGELSGQQRNMFSVILLFKSAFFHLSGCHMESQVVSRASLSLSNIEILSPVIKKDVFSSSGFICGFQSVSSQPS